jgi:hypothetical protein
MRQKRASENAFKISKISSNILGGFWLGALELYAFSEAGVARGKVFLATA